MPGPAFGETPSSAFSGQSATTAQSVVLDNAYARSHHSLQVVAGAGVTAGVVALQVSNDNQNWFTTSASVSTTAPGVYVATLANSPFQYVRAAITTAITGGTVSATVASAG